MSDISTDLVVLSACNKGGQRLDQLDLVVYLNFLCQELNRF